MRDLTLERVAIVGPGRLGTALSYKFARDGKEVALYYHNADFCRELNETRLNPRHLTKDLVRLSGTLEKVPRLPNNVQATNDLEKIVEENDTVILSVTMQRLPDVLTYLKPLMAQKKKPTLLISPIKGLASDEKTKSLVTPSQVIQNHLFDIPHKYELLCIGGPFFDVDIALGKPVCVTIAGNKKTARTVKKELIELNRRELAAFYNFDMIGVEACGALKNIVANLKGVFQGIHLGNSIPGTLFARSGVEIRSLSKILGGSFQSFYSQAGVGDMYVTLSSDASKNYRYGVLYYENYTGNPVETHMKVLEKIDGTPEGPNTIRNVHLYLERKNMYSPLFHCAFKIFNEIRKKDEIEERIIQACQFDQREKEYIGIFSRVLYRLFPALWYRRHKGILSRFQI